MDFSIIKKYPVAFGAIAIAVFAIVYFAASGGGTGTQVVQSGPTDAQVQAGYAAQAMVYQNAASAADKQFQLTYLQQTQAGEFAMANLQAQTTLLQQGAAIQGQVDLAALAAELTKYTTDVGKEIQLTGLKIQENISMREFQAQENLSKLTSETSLALAKISADQSYAMTELATNAALATAAINADAFKFQIGATTQTQLAQIAAWQTIQGKQIKSNNLGGVVGAISSIVGVIF